MPDSSISSITRLRQVLRIVAAAPRAGLVGGVLLICCALMLLLQGLNLGSVGIPGSAPAADNPAPKTASAQSSQTASRSIDSPDPPDLSLTGLPVLTVLIDERSYRVQVPADPAPLYRDSSLEQIHALASTTTGDSNGIRVRILRRETARQSAETALQQTLEQAGITADAILMPSEIVP